MLVYVHFVKSHGVRSVAAIYLQINEDLKCVRYDLSESLNDLFPDKLLDVAGFYFEETQVASAGTQRLQEQQQFNLQGCWTRLLRCSEHLDCEVCAQDRKTPEGRGSNKVIQQSIWQTVGFGVLFLPVQLVTSHHGEARLKACACFSLLRQGNFAEVSSRLRLR